MNTVEKLVKETIRNAIVLNVMFFLIGAFISDNPMAYGIGLIFGALIGVINFVELGRTLNRLFK